MNRPSFQRILLRISPELKLELEAFAERHDISVNAAMNLLIRHGLDRTATMTYDEITRKSAARRPLRRPAFPDVPEKPASSNP